jgi:outer membrane protein assembly factor BamB
VPRRRRRSRARSQRLLLGFVLVLALVAGVGVATRHRTHAVARAAIRRPLHRVARLAPPPPIPGYLLIADRGNNRMLLVDAAKHVYWRYPPPSRPTPMPFRFDDDTFFSPAFDRIISNQEDQHTIQIVSFPGGRLDWRYGHVNVRSSAAGYLNTPDDAYLLRNGLVTVADAYNCRVLFIDRAHRVVRRYGTTGVCRHDPPRELGAINGATPLPDGGTLVSEINGSWVDDIGPDGTLRWAVQAPVSYPSDPQLIGPGRILIADYAHPGHALIMTSRGRVLWRYGPSSGPGELDHPSLAFRIAPGLVAINDDYRDRVVIVDIHTNRIVWQYGHTDRPGTGPDSLNTPDGLDLLPTVAAQRLPVLRKLLSARPHATRRPTTRRATVSLVVLPHRLPAPVQRAAAVASGGGIVIAGGLDAGGASTNGVFRLDPRSGRIVALGSVPQPFHDAAAALIRGKLVVFGGGAAASSAAVQTFDLATRRGAVAGQLPHPLSDVVAAKSGGTVYLVGGYDGTTARAEIYATTDGTHFVVAGRLPRGLRYPAVAAAAGRLVIAGGADAAGAPTAAVYAFDPRTGSVSRIGSLPTALAHAAAIASGNNVYLVGGIGATGATGRALLRIDATTGTVTRAATAAPVADAAVAAPYLIGGSRNGHAVADVSELHAR